MQRPGVTAIQDPTAHLLFQSPPSSPASADGALPGRFSALTARQRQLVDDFVAEARPWALRQARRAYAHLPAELHEQAVDQAALDLRTGTASRLDRRALYGRFADALNASLARIHTGWCLNQARGAWDVDTIDGQPAPADAAHLIAGFVEEGLGGLERAVLQLEIGAGRDTATARAALRLGPVQYKRHRERGLSKLRSAITAQVAGRVCGEHASAVVLAATGDGTAAAGLAAGPDRCRACAREAAALRRVLHGRLAIAPWPLAVKPAGVLAAKLGVLGAALGGKGGGAAGSSAGVAKGVAALLAAAAATTGLVAGQDGRPAPLPATGTAAGAEPVPPAAAGRATVATARTAKRRAARPERRVATEQPKRRRVADRRTATAPPKRPATQEVVETRAPAGSAPAAATPPQQAVRDTVATVERATGKVVTDVRAGLPALSAPQTAAPPAAESVEQVTGAAGQLLAP